MESHLFDFELPPAQIAQRPLEPRDSSKLLVCKARGRLGQWSNPFAFEHKVFREIETLLGPNDLLVLNDAKVLPVRLLGRRASAHPDQGGHVEALLLKRINSDERPNERPNERMDEWSALLHLSAQVKPGLQILFEPGLVAEVLSTHEERLRNQGEVRLRF